jgi:GTPase SAR1 family protein
MEIGEGNSVHIAVCGGSGVGKTSYIMMAMRELKNMCTKRNVKCNQCIVALTDPIQAQSMEASLRSIKNGEALPATNELTPRASIWKIQLPDMRKQKYIHVYDPAGKVFTTYENVSRQAYYRYADGLIFVVDPFTIQSFNYSYHSENKQTYSVREAGTLDVVQSYERMMNALEMFHSLGKRNRYTLPLAVVVTRVDMPALENEIGGSAARALMIRNSYIASEPEAIHALVRGFLCSHGLDNVVRDMEIHFTHVRYFSCSAQGRTHGLGDGSEFVPIRVLDPLLWLFTHTGVLSDDRR